MDKFIIEFVKKSVNFLVGKDKNITTKELQYELSNIFYFPIIVTKNSNGYNIIITWEGENIKINK